MKAIITNNPKIGPDKMIDIHFDIYDGDELIHADLSHTCLPSKAQEEIRGIVSDFQAEYEASQVLTNGLEID
jgi:hypothetical protein